MPTIENLHSTAKKLGGYHLAPFVISRSRVKGLSAIKALRKKNLFSGIYKSDQFTVEAAYNAFAGVTFKK